MLERGSGRRVKVLEKDDLFTAADVEHYLCVMLRSLHSANRQNNRDFLKMFQVVGDLAPVSPRTDGHIHLGLGHIDPYVDTVL